MSASPQQKISAEFWYWLQEHPDATVAAIIRTEMLSSEIEQSVLDAGCRVNRRLKLLPSLAVEAPASVLMQLAAKPWVQRIEPDQSVRSL